MENMNNAQENSKDTLASPAAERDAAPADSKVGATNKHTEKATEKRDALAEARVGRSTLIMAVATTLSRITGFIRAWALALALGTTAVSSAYHVANNVPNMIFELVAGGILSSLFIPTFMKVRKERGDEAAWRFAGNLMSLVALVLGLVALIGILFPTPIMWTQYFLTGDSGYTEELLALASFFFRFFAIQAVFYGVGMIIQALLNAQRKYLWASLGPVFNNLVVIGFLVSAYYFMSFDETMFTIIALGTSLGVLVMFLVMMPSLRKTGFRLHLGINLKDPDLRAMLKLALPMIFYVICNLIAVSVRNAAAATTGPDSQAVIFFASIWQSLPYGIIAVSVATALFTELSKAATEKNMEEFKTSLVTGLRTTTLLMLPASALLFGLAYPLIQLYVGGRMSVEDAAPIVTVLQVWAVSLVFFAGMMYLLRAFYSLRDTWTPAIANFFLTIIQIAGYLLLTGAVLSGNHFGVVGIPIADGIFFTLLFITLLLLLRRKIGSFDILSFLGVFLKMSVVAVFIAFTTYFGQGFLAAFIIDAGIMAPGRLLALVIVIIMGVLGIAITAATAQVLRIEEIATFGRSIKRRLSRSKT